MKNWNGWMKSRKTKMKNKIKTGIWEKNLMEFGEKKTPPNYDFIQSEDFEHV